MPRNNRRGKKPGHNKAPKFNVPFYDRGRPNAPYVRGSQWTIQEHTPPPPFGQGYRLKHRRGPAALALMLREQLPQSMYCLKNPPPGPEPPANATRVTIEVVEELRVHAGRGAQVVACRVIDGPTPPGAAAGAVLVAKICDPLYYYYSGDYDIIESADMEYSREAAAYAHLKHEGVDGELLPSYHGSYTMNVPLTEEQREILADCGNTSLNQTTRPVRLTLMGLIDGEAMTYQLVFGDVHKLPDEVRMRAIGTSMEAYAKLYHHGVVQGDLAPRNIFLRQVAHTGFYRELVFHRFVDLGLAYVLGSSALKSTYPRQPAQEQRPRSPIRLFWNVVDSGVGNMYHWIPERYRSTHAFQAWMLQRWYGDPRYEPIGPEPQPSADRDPWGSSPPAKVLSWTADEKKNVRGNGSKQPAGPPRPVTTARAPGGGHTGQAVRPRTTTTEQRPTATIAEQRPTATIAEQHPGGMMNSGGRNVGGNMNAVYAAMEVKGFW